MAAAPARQRAWGQRRLANGVRVAGAERWAAGRDPLCARWPAEARVNHLSAATSATAVRLRLRCSRHPIAQPNRRPQELVPQPAPRSVLAAPRARVHPPRRTHRHHQGCGRAGGRVSRVVSQERRQSAVILPEMREMREPAHASRQRCLPRGQRASGRGPAAARPRRSPIRPSTFLQEAVDRWGRAQRRAHEARRATGHAADRRATDRARRQPGKKVIAERSVQPSHAHRWTFPPPVHYRTMMVWYIL